MMKHDEFEYLNATHEIVTSYDPKDDRFHYFVGESNVNQQSVSGQYFKKMAVGILIDVKTSEIVDANVTMISPVGKNFVCSQFRGRNIIDDYDTIISCLTRYHSTTQKSIIVAFKQAYEIYTRWLESKSK